MNDDQQIRWVPPNGITRAWVIAHIQCPDCGVRAGDRCREAGIERKSSHQQRSKLGRLKWKYLARQARP